MKYKKYIASVITLVILLVGAQIVNAQTVVTSIDPNSLKTLLNSLIAELISLEQQYIVILQNQLALQQQLNSQASSTQVLATTSPLSVSTPSTSTFIASPNLQAIQSTSLQVVQTTTVDYTPVPQTGGSSPAALTVSQPTTTSMIVLGNPIPPYSAIFPFVTILTTCSNSFPQYSNGWEVSRELVASHGDWFTDWNLSSLTDTKNPDGTEVVSFSEPVQMITQNDILPSIQSKLSNDGPVQTGGAYASGTTGYWDYKELLNVQSTTYPIVCGSTTIQ